MSETCTFSLLTFCEAWDRSTQTPSSLFWHNATTAVTGQAGSHESVSSSGSKLIPNHSSSRPAGGGGHNLFKLYDIRFEVQWKYSWLKALEWLTFFEWADLDSSGIYHCWPSLWGIYWQRFNLISWELLLIDTDHKPGRNFTSMQRQGKGREKGKVMLFTGSSFFIWKVNKALWHIYIFLWHVRIGSWGFLSHMIDKPHIFHWQSLVWVSAESFQLSILTNTVLSWRGDYFLI